MMFWCRASGQGALPPHVLMWQSVDMESCYQANFRAQAAASGAERRPPVDGGGGLQPCAVLVRTSAKLDMDSAHLCDQQARRRAEGRPSKERCAGGHKPRVLRGASCP